MSGLRVLKPLTVGNSTLTSSTVPEPATGDSPDPAAYAAGTTYAIGARVYVASNHTIYESAIASNLGNDPTLAANSAKWLTVGATNRWRMFDQRNSSKTTATGGFNVVVTPGTAYNAMAALNVTNVSSIRAVMVDPTAGTVYDTTAQMQSPPSEPDWYIYFFEAIANLDTLILDLPTYRNASLQVYFNTANGSDVAGVGVLAVGTMYEWGQGVNKGARVGIQDYSIKQQNSYGDYTVVQRAFSKRASFDLWIAKTEVDAALNFMANIRSTPVVWIGASTYTSTVVYGFYKDFDLNLAFYDISSFSLTIEGLT